MSLLLYVNVSPLVLPTPLIVFMHFFGPFLSSTALRRTLPVSTGIECQFSRLYFSPSYGRLIVWDPLRMPNTAEYLWLWLRYCCRQAHPTRSIARNTLPPFVRLSTSPHTRLHSPPVARRWGACCLDLEMCVSLRSLLGLYVLATPPPTSITVGQQVLPRDIQEC
jgi:hypothetical protein